MWPNFNCVDCWTLGWAGPLLFLLFINSVTKVFNQDVTCILFADDVKLHSVRSLYDCVNLQSALDNDCALVQSQEVFKYCQSNFLHVNYMGENPPTRSNRPPTPGISPKWLNRLFFVILWPVERVVPICLNTV